MDPLTEDKYSRCDGSSSSPASPLHTTAKRKLRAVPWFFSPSDLVASIQKAMHFNAMSCLLPLRKVLTQKFTSSTIDAWCESLSQAPKINMRDNDRQSLLRFGRDYKNHEERSTMVSLFYIPSRFRPKPHWLGLYVLFSRSPKHLQSLLMYSSATTRITLPRTMLVLLPSKSKQKQLSGSNVCSQLPQGYTYYTMAAASSVAFTLDATSKSS